MRAAVAQAGARGEQALPLPSQTPIRLATAPTRGPGDRACAQVAGPIEPSRWSRNSRDVYRVPADDAAIPLALLQVRRPLGTPVTKTTAIEDTEPTLISSRPSWTPPKSPAGRPVFPNSSPRPRASSWQVSRHPAQRGPHRATLPPRTTNSQLDRPRHPSHPSRRSHHRAVATDTGSDSTRDRGIMGVRTPFRGDFDGRSAVPKRKRGPLGHSRPNSGHHRSAVRYAQV